jgi:hypothetical protein
VVEKLFGLPNPQTDVWAELFQAVPERVNMETAEFSAPGSMSKLGLTDGSRLWVGATDIQSRRTGPIESIGGRMCMPSYVKVEYECRERSWPGFREYLFNLTRQYALLGYSGFTTLRQDRHSTSLPAVNFCFGDYSLFEHLPVELPALFLRYEEDDDCLAEILSICAEHELPELATPARI